MNKPKVGDVVILIELRWNKAVNVRDVTVTKVGSKYFYIDGIYQTKFCVNTWRQVTDYSASYRLYPDKQAYDDELEYEALLNEIRKIFNHGSNRKISLDSLRQIKQILDGKEDAKEV